MVDDISINIRVQFEQFLSTVGNALSHEKEIHLIQNKLRRHFNTTSSSYLSSTDFQSLITRVRHSFTENDKSTKFFTLLNLLDEQLKKHNVNSIGSKQQPSNEPTLTLCTSPHVIVLESSLSTVDKSVIDDPILSTLNESSKSNTTEESRMTINSDHIETRRKTKIVKLERRLSNLSKIIRKLEMKELSLDEMQYSDLYQVEGNLKKQAYDLYMKIADLKNQSPSVERLLDQRVTLIDEEIDHPLINKALEDMVNRTKFLPSFNDVFDIVEKTNDQYELYISDETRKVIAEKAFKIIGMKVKDRRMADFNDIMKSRLPENFDIEQNDPAWNSVEIENRLSENEREAQLKTQKILEEFSRIDPNLESDVDIKSSEESTVESDEEEEENAEEADAESNGSVDSSGNKPGQYDVADVLPPFSPKSSSASSSNSIEATLKKFRTDRTSKILPTTSIPVKRTTQIPYDSMAQNSSPDVLTILDEDDNTKESQPTSIIPRRRQHQNPSSERLYSSYRQRITTNDFSSISKRSSQDFDSSRSKKRSEIVEVVILD